MIQSKLKTLLILTIMACLFPNQTIASDLETNKSDKCKAQFTPSDLGIILQKHPDQAKFDYSNKKNEPVILEGKVITKIEKVESIDAGSYVVEIASGLNIVDKKRKKLIPIEVAYPKNAGNYPIIIFSHAAIASGRDYRALAAFWASHGFITVLPTHSDALTLQLEPGQKTSIFKLLKLANTKMPTLKNRALDLSKTIDSLELLPDKIASLSGKLNSTKIALIGDHTGSLSAQLLTGVTVKGKKKLVKERPTVSASIYFVRSNWGLPKLKRLDWQKVKVPTMVISFSNPKNNQQKIRKELNKTLNVGSTQDRYLVTVDNTKFKKPSRKKLRKLFKESNIEIISWRPFQRAKKRRKNRQQRRKSALAITSADPNELPGTHLAGILGLTQLNKKEDSNERFKFAMSTTLPFLNTYLKDDAKARDLLSDSKEFNYSDDIVIKVNSISDMN